MPNLQQFINSKKQRLARISDELDFVQRELGSRREESEKVRSAEADLTWCLINLRNALRTLGWFKT